jgi:chromosome condensin MukBEF ATPase and DNA-binding subunit MukB
MIKETPEQVYARFKKEFDESHNTVDAFSQRFANVVDPSRQEKYAKRRDSARSEQLMCESERTRLERELQAMKRKIARFDEELRQLESDYQAGLPII